MPCCCCCCASLVKISTNYAFVFTTVLTRDVAPPTESRPTNELIAASEEWSGCLKTPVCLFIVLSQRPCANGRREGQCCVGCSLHKLSACGTSAYTQTHTPPRRAAFCEEKSRRVCRVPLDHLSSKALPLPPPPFLSPLMTDHLGPRMQRAATMRRLRS